MEQVIQRIFQPNRSSLVINHQQRLIIRNIAILLGLYALFAFGIYTWFMASFDAKTSSFYPDREIRLMDSQVLSRETMVVLPDRPDDSYRLDTGNIEIFQTDPAIQFNKFDPYLEDHRLTILGTVNNLNDYSVNSQDVSVNLYDATGQNIYNCSNNTETIAANGTGNFSVVCGCAKNPVPAFSSMQVTLN